jgi:two-component system response regulator YesN
MFRLLIVDDEPIIVEGLYELFMDYKKYEIEVYKAYSSDEAIRILEYKRMDVVLTDIKMPGMDGLQLLDMICSNWSDCKVIFLTGYSEFDYVYRAIQHDHARYLLKTKSYQIVVETVEKCFDEIEKSLRDNELVNKAKDQMKKAIPLLQKDFLAELIDGTSRECTQDILDELQIPLLAEMPVIMVVGRFDFFSGKVRMAEQLQHYYAVRIIAKKFLAPLAGSVDVLLKGTHVIWLIQPVAAIEPCCGGNNSYALCDRQMSVLRGAFESVQAVCRGSLDASISFALAGELLQWSGIADKYVNLRSILNSRIGTSMEMVLVDESFYKSESGRMFNTGKAGQQMPTRLKRIDLLNACLEQGRREEFLAALYSLKNDLGERPISGGSLACEVYCSISVLFLSYINRSNIGDKIFAEYSIGELMQVDRFSSPEEAFQFFEHLARDIFSIQNFEYQIRSAAAVKQTLQYIQEHLDADLSLARLAEMVYFNPKYFSRLFKQIVGIHLSDYIDELKVKKAKELLSRNQLKITEIAYSLGYLSAPYFTRFFKKAMNMTPQEYRNSLMMSH